jgi:3',5'-cyclic AMP phosphodiesterase CpdA
MSTPTEPATTVRLAHISDLHLPTPLTGWRRRDWFSKRLTGWINLRWLGRQRRFRHAADILAALTARFRHTRPDRVVFTGDATNLGLDGEFARAAELLGLGGPDPLPGITVPGNHDHYNRAVVADALFERHFDAWQVGHRVDGSRYPFAQRVGHLWLVALNSSYPNRWAWDASGRVGAEQLERLKRLLADLDGGLRVLVTHYPVCLASGRPEPWAHGLRDLADVVRVAAEGGVCLWLHGHRHGAYHHAKSRFAPFPVVCAGSSTQTGRWCHGEYTITGRHFHGVRRIYDPHEKAFRDGGVFEFELPPA